MERLIAVRLYLDPSETVSRIMTEEDGEDGYEVVLAYLKIYVKKTITTCLAENQQPGYVALRLGIQCSCTCIYLYGIHHQLNSYAVKSSRA